MALALTSRRSTVAAIASAMAAMALAAAVAGRGCRVNDPGPEAAVRDMYQAAKIGDRDAVFELLGPDTRANLEAQAKRSTDLVGGAVRYSAKDLISIGSSEGFAAPTSFNVREFPNDRGEVEVVTSAGVQRLEMVRVDGHWKIELRAYGQ